MGPVHCLILRGPNRTVVRRWSPNTRLNRRDFTESELEAGDCLSVGGIDLEVVETAQSDLPSEDLREQQRPIDRQLAQIEARVRSLDKQQAETRCSQHPVRRASVGHGKLDARRPKSPTRPRPKNWRRLQAELRRRHLPYDQRQAATETMNAEMRQQLAARGAELEALGAEIQSRQTALEAERRRWEANDNEQTVRRAAEAEQLAARQERKSKLAVLRWKKSTVHQGDPEGPVAGRSGRPRSSP